MTQQSGPVNKRSFSVGEWRIAIGNEPGIKEDIDGSAYGWSLSTNSDEVFLGSATQDSLSTVGGAYHLIPAGTTHPVVVPAATSGARSDLIVVRYDPAWAVLPTDETAAAAHVGPCRLHRIAGVEGSNAPTYDASPPGVEDFPILEIRRTPGTALSSNGTTVIDRRICTGPNLYAPTSTTPLPLAAPLGTRLHRGSGGNADRLIRVLDDEGAPNWQSETLAGLLQNVELDGPWQQDSLDPFQVYRVGDEFVLKGSFRSASPGTYSTPEAHIGTVPAGTQPGTRRIFPATANLNNVWVAANVVVNTDRTVKLNLSQGTGTVQPAGAFVVAVGSASWRAR